MQGSFNSVSVHQTLSVSSSRETQEVTTRWLGLSTARSWPDCNLQPVSVQNSHRPWANQPLRLRTVLYFTNRTERRAQMLTTNATDNPMFVISLDIDPNGQAKTRIPDIEKSAQLHNTLLQCLFPKVRVARLNVPGGAVDESHHA